MFKRPFSIHVKNAGNGHPDNEHTNQPGKSKSSNEHASSSKHAIYFRTERGYDT